MDNILSDKEAKFCLLYVNGKNSGDARKCYQDVFCESDETRAMYEAKKLIAKDCVKERLKELNNVEVFSASTLKHRITETLIGIMDECSKSEYTDKDGNLVQPAAMRAVSVHAAKTLNDMYGIKEDIAHSVNVNVGGENGNGVTFIVNAPQPRDKSEEEKIV